MDFPHKKQSTTFSDLPDCILIDIFAFVDSIRDSNDIRLVCHRWNRLILSYWSKREKLTLTKYIKDPAEFLEYASANSKRHPKIKELAIEPVDRSNLPHRIEKVPKHYSSIAGLFPKLEKIVFYDTLMDDEALAEIVGACTELRAVYLHSCHEISDIGLANALNNHPQIKELEIFGCPEVNCDFAAQCGKLVYLGFEDCPFDTDAWVMVSEAGGKETLEKLAFNPMKYEQLCLISSQFPNLKNLYIPEFEEEDCFDSADYLGFPKVEVLCVTYGSVSDKEILLEIISKCPKLNTLWIWDCSSKSIDIFVDELMSHFMDRLDHLILDDLKPKYLETMNFRYFGRLKKFTIIGTELSNQILQRIIDSCLMLDFLDIADSVPPNDFNIKAPHDFWLNMRYLGKKPSVVNTEPPFRANYKSVEDSYEGPVLELSCGPKRPRYFYEKQND